MASILSTASLGLVSYHDSNMEGSSMNQSGIGRHPVFSTPSHIRFHGKRARSLLVVKAEGQSVNPEVRKNKEKVKKHEIRLVKINTLTASNHQQFDVGGRELSLFVMGVMLSIIRLMVIMLDRYS